MKYIPTLEGIEESKYNYEPSPLTPKEEALDRVRKLSRICGHNRKLWVEVMPGYKKIDGEWVGWLDLPPEEMAAGLEKTAELLARKKRWIKQASSMKMPGGWMMWEAFWQVEGYSPGYLGNKAYPMMSPEKTRKMQQWGWDVWRRARQILRPYGWAPSRKALQAALISHTFGQVGKIAVRVAAASLPVMFGGGLRCDASRGHNRPSSLRGLKEAREALIKARGWGQMRKRWGHDPEVIECIVQVVKLHKYSIDKAEYLVVNTIFSVDSAPDSSGFVRSPLTGGKLQERILFDHAEGCNWSSGRVAKNFTPPQWSVSDCKVYSCANPICTDYHTRYDHHAAIQAWKKQIAAYNLRVESSAKLKELLNRPDGATTIVFFATSLETGNCKIGTEYWAARHGYKNAAPLSEVVKDGRYEARRVVDYVARTY